MSLDILYILSLASASMVCSCERVSKECNLLPLFYKTKSGLSFCRGFFPLILEKKLATILLDFLKCFLRHSKGLWFIFSVDIMNSVQTD